MRSSYLSFLVILLLSFSFFHLVYAESDFEGVDESASSSSGSDFETSNGNFLSDIGSAIGGGITNFVDGVKGAFSGGSGGGTAIIPSVPASTQADLKKSVVKKAIDDYNSLKLEWVAKGYNWDNAEYGDTDFFGDNSDDEAMTKFVDDHKGAFTVAQYTSMDDGGERQGSDILAKLEDNLKEAKDDTSWFGGTSLITLTKKDKKSSGDADFLSPSTWENAPFVGAFFGPVGNFLVNGAYGAIFGLYLFLILLASGFVSSIKTSKLYSFVIGKEITLTSALGKAIGTIITFLILWLLFVYIPYIPSIVSIICLIIWIFGMIRKVDKSSFLVFGSFSVFNWLNSISSTLWSLALIHALVVVFASFVTSKIASIGSSVSQKAQNLKDVLSGADQLAPVFRGRVKTYD